MSAEHDVSQKFGFIDKAATFSIVVARLDRAIQYTTASVYWITRFRG
jgi:hypothetical protein